MRTVTLAASTAPALTVGLAVYAALILGILAVAVDGARRRRRRQAITAAVIVGVLTLGGLVVAIISSVA